MNLVVALEAVDSLSHLTRTRPCLTIICTAGALGRECQAEA